jgi:O-methyltransferase involved in polyketide biosynthesis
MQKVSVAGLTGAQATLLIPLLGRARESSHDDPILVDRKAAELIETLDFDFASMDRTTNHVGLCARARLFDGLVQTFLNAHPAGTIVEIGAGLDTRFDRIDNGRATWLELDLPSVMEVRRRFFPETPRRTLVASSVLDFSWCDRLSAADPSQLLFSAEGVFYFLGQDGVQTLLGELARRFPGCRVVFDSESPFFLWYSNLSHPFQKSPMKWALGDPRDVERWDPRFRLEHSIGFGDSPEYDPILHRFPRLQRVARRLFPATVRNMFRVNQVRLG